MAWGWKQERIVAVGGVGMEECHLCDGTLIAQDAGGTRCDKCGTLHFDSVNDTPLPQEIKDRFACAICHQPVRGGHCGCV